MSFLDDLNDTLTTLARELVDTNIALQCLALAIAKQPNIDRKRLLADFKQHAVARCESEELDNRLAVASLIAALSR